MPPYNPVDIDAVSVSVGTDIGFVGCSRRTRRLASLDNNNDETIDQPPPPPPPSREGSHRSERGGKPPAAPSFYCPLTMAVMADPVQDREGNSYEKDAIEKWLSDNCTSPITRNRLRRKHLIPNRALKEAIDFEVKRQEEINQSKEEIISSRSSKTTRQSTAISESAKPDRNTSTVRRNSKSTKSARSNSTSTTSTNAHSATNYNHHEIINNFLSTLNVKSRLDKFGIAMLPMNKLQQPTTMAKNNNEQIINNMLMVIEAPLTKETFQLYTHFDLTNEKQSLARRRGSSRTSREERAETNENRVYSDLLQHGKHKALTLTKVCENRVRFGFEGKNCEISSMSKVRGMLNMFVKVSFRMKKRIEE